MNTLKRIWDSAMVAHYRTMEAIPEMQTGPHLTLPHRDALQKAKAEAKRARKNAKRVRDDRRSYIGRGRGPVPDRWLRADRGAAALWVRVVGKAARRHQEAR